MTSGYLNFLHYKFKRIYVVSIIRKAGLLGTAQWQEPAESRYIPNQALDRAGIFVQLITQQVQ